MSLRRPRPKGWLSEGSGRKGYGGPREGLAGEPVRAFELIVDLPNRPGELAAAAGAIGRENVNIRAFAILGTGKSDEARFIVDDAEAALAALVSAGYKARRQEVLSVPASNTPGELAALSDKLSRAGVNIEGGFMAASERDGHFEIIFEVADIGAARKALK